MPSRRLLLSWPLALAWTGVGAQAQQRRSMADPLRLGVDVALFDSGLARSLQRGFGRDTGLPVLLVPGPALPMLDSLGRGEIDAALGNAPEAQARLEAQGLAHDKRLIALGEFILVGPAPRSRTPGSLQIAGTRDAAEAFARLAAAALAAPGSVRFMSALDGSGAHTLEQAVWRRARIAPAAPWYVQTAPGAGLVAQARAAGAHALVERGAWLVHGGAPLAALVAGDALLAETVHVLRAFHGKHPAARVFIDWIAGPKGRRIVAAQRGYRTAAA